MHVLFLDIASSTGLLACSTEECVVAYRAIDHRIGDHELVPLIEEVLKEAGWTLPTLTHLVCVIGPGGFTSLRVGVSCINALSWTLKIPVAGVHLSDLYAARVPPSPNPFPPAGEKGLHSPLPQTGEGQGVGGIWLHSTKRTELFVRGFGNFAREWPQPTHMVIEDLLQKFAARSSCLAAPIPYVGELLPEHCTMLEEAGFVGLFPCPVTDVLPQFLSSLTYTNQVLQPWYGRGW